MQDGWPFKRKYPRISGIPIDVYLKAPGASGFLKVTMIDISVGGFMINCNFDLNIYSKLETKIDIPVDEEKKKSIYGKSIVWRVEPDTEGMDSGYRFIACKFVEISEEEKQLVKDYLKAFSENVPYR